MSGVVKQAEEVGAGDDTSIFFFLSSFIFRFYVMLFILLLIFISLLFYLFTFFMKITFIFSCSGIFRDVPECSVFLVLSTPQEEVETR